MNPTMAIKVTLDAVCLETVDNISRCEIENAEGEKLTIYYDHSSGRTVPKLAFLGKKLG